MLIDEMYSQFDYKYFILDYRCFECDDIHLAFDYEGFELDYCFFVNGY